MKSYVIHYKEYSKEDVAESVVERQFNERPYIVREVEIVASNPKEAVQMMAKDMKISRGFILDVFEKQITKINRSEYVQ